jgi:cytochrome c-type biogenesis protein CcmH/NrfG
MHNLATKTDSLRANWRPSQVYVLATVCLLIGVSGGYLFRGSEGARATAAVSADPTKTAQGEASAPRMPTLEQMKHMADKKTEPLLEKLKTDPNNADLLGQVGAIYKSTHQFKEAAAYYEKSLQIDPRNAGTRTEMASCLYYTGDVDGALAQLQQALNDHPNDANSLFNLGVIKWQGKQDSKGAVAAWQQLLKSNPQLEANRKAQVEKLIADARLGSMKEQK